MSAAAIILIVGYFLPAIIASSRGHRSAGAIFVLNLLLGWMVLGWVVAFVWAFTGNTRRNAARYAVPRGMWTVRTTELVQRPKSDFGMIARMGRKV